MKESLCSRKWLLILIDCACFAATYIGILLIAPSTSTGIILGGKETFFNAGVLFCGIFFVRWCVRVYFNVWRYANSRAYLQIVVSDLLGGGIALVISRALGYYVGIWQTISVVMAFDVITLASRFVYQMFYRHLNVNFKEINKIGVAIVGAGQTGTLLAEELCYEKNSHYRPVCFIDIDPQKIGSRIDHCWVYDAKNHIIEKLSSLPVQEIFFALPALSAEKIGQLYHFYSQSNCKIKIYDFPTQSVERKASPKRILRDFNIEDLLFRDTLKVTNPDSLQFYQGKRVLVTGGGGSIGSELCRQIANLGPAQLIILDSYENNAYNIQQELRQIYGKRLDLQVEIASVRDRQRLEMIFRYYRPEIVFHAAANKHVPLMEQSQGEAVKTNVFGTYNVANMAEKFGTKKFVMISTDKAVHPTSVMGATKRMCELIVQSRTDSATSFAAVRFGNVLGSNGSVVPLFQKQIEKGGPITITDRRIIRYFMTIPEAVQLVMQAGSMAKRGELFVLDMGKPVKILDLAENMIQLSGLKPYEDIDIVEIGLRPGEKLYEELLIKKNNSLYLTDNEMIFVERDTPLSCDEIERKLMILRKALQQSEGGAGKNRIKEALKQVVPEFDDPEEVNKKAIAEDLLLAAGK